MTAFLLLLLIAQPAPDESWRVVQQLARQLGEANRFIESDPEEAIRLVTALLDDPKGQELESSSPHVRFYREQALYFRARLHLKQGQAQVVVDDMTTLLDRKRVAFGARLAGLVGSLASPLPHTAPGSLLSFPPEAPLSRMDCFQALGLRAEAYNALDQHDKEQADRAEAQAILLEMMRGVSATPAQPPNRPLGRPWWSVPSPWRLDTWRTGLTFVAASLLVMFPLFFLRGRRQRRDAGGTWWRLTWVSLTLAAAQAAPVLAAVLLLRWHRHFADVSEVGFVTLMVFAINVGRHCGYLTAVKWRHGREAPPRLEDPVILDRIAGIAGRMGIAPPVTRVVRSATSLQTNQALVSGLVAPTMVLFDGVLHRLTEEERDAIIAHELAHLANRTFWYWLAAGVVCSVGVVAASAFYPTLVSLSLGLALLTGSWLILSQWLELDCDRRAARAIGHRRAVSALWKIHADQPWRGLLEFLIGAVSTHPSRDQRLAAIRAAAPDDDKPEVTWDTRLLRRRRLAAWGAFGLWLAVMVACLAWGYRSPESLWPALPLVLLVMAPFTLVWLGGRKAARRKSRLQRARRSRLRHLTWLPPLLFGGILVAHLSGLTERYLSLWASLALLSGGFLALLLLNLVLGRDRAKKLNRQLVIAIQSGDYPKALALCEGSLAVVAGNTELRYNHALIRAVLGRREEALADLDRLRQDDPGFKMTSLLMASICADEEDYARALELANQLSHDLPGDPVGPQAEAWLLRKLGQLEEAETRARDVLKLEPRSGQAHLTLAAVAFDRGDQAGARELLAQAERLMPGTVGSALLAAEMALAADDNAEIAVQQAVKAAKNNPLAFADKEVARLVQRLEARRQPLPS